MQKKSSKKRATKQSARKCGGAEPTEYLENGHEVLDLAAASRNDKRAANQLLAVMESEIVPRWVREALADALVEAAQRKESPLLAPVLQDGTVTVTPNSNPYFQNLRRNLATLIGITPGNFTLRLSDREQLAQAISTVLNSKLTPPRLERAVGDFICDTTSYMTTAWQNSPETVEKVLASGRCGYGDCKGTNDGSICGGPDEKGEHWTGERGTKGYSRLSLLSTVCVLMLVLFSLVPFTLPIRAAEIPELPLPPMVIEFVITDEPGLIPSAYRPRPRNPRRAQRDDEPCTAEEPCYKPCITYPDGTINDLVSCYGDE
jgi:hypothetical protein